MEAKLKLSTLLLVQDDLEKTWISKLVLGEMQMNWKGGCSSQMEQQSTRVPKDQQAVAAEGQVDTPQDVKLVDVRVAMIDVLKGL